MIQGYFMLYMKIHLEVKYVEAWLEIHWYWMRYHEARGILRCERNLHWGRPYLEARDTLKCEKSKFTLKWGTYLEAIGTLRYFSAWKGYTYLHRLYVITADPTLRPEWISVRVSPRKSPSSQPRSWITGIMKKLTFECENSNFHYKLKSLLFSLALGDFWINSNLPCWTSSPIWFWHPERDLEQSG